MVSPSQRIAEVGHLMKSKFCTERKVCHILELSQSHYRKHGRKNEDGRTSHH